MQNYHNLMQRVLSEGTRQANRTGTDAITVSGETLKYDLRDGFPAITTKKLAFKSVKGELLGFFRGYTSAAQFRSLECQVWNANANETASWVNSPFRKGEDDLGRIYGAQWTDWQDTKVVPLNELHLLPAYEKLGYSVQGALTTPSGVAAGTVIHRSINQLDNALLDLLTNPTSRRIIINGWNSSENDQLALFCCHAQYQFLANVEANELHLCLTIRSNDLLLGHAFNAGSAAIFLSIMARLSGFTPATLTIFIGDAHIYANHVDQVNEQLRRAHFPAPKLILSDRIRRVERIEDIAGIFAAIEPADITLEGYQSHAAIKAPMAA